VAYAVKLDVFEGPLDLLLQLVSRERVNVADICIADVTEEFLRVLDDMGEVDLETASSFLVLAATLLELKSLKLLPDRNLTDPEIKLLLEERDRLLHRLIVYSTFKEAAARVGILLAENAGFHSRTADLPPELIPAAPDVFKGLTPQMIAAAAASALSSDEKPTVDTSHVTPATVSLSEMVERLRARIRSAGSSSFRRLCAGASARIEIVVSFLALLELFKSESVGLDQSQPFGEIEVSWLTPP
jgi:segregation and condensation protein A